MIHGFVFNRVVSSGSIFLPLVFCIEEKLHYFCRNKFKFSIYMNQGTEEIKKKIIAELASAGFESRVEYQPPLSNGLHGLYLINIEGDDKYEFRDVIISVLERVGEVYSLELGDSEGDENFTLRETLWLYS